jgi:nucleoside-diphosphate-sugar epimerase
MRIFVTGATGYVGGAIVEALVRTGHEVSGLSRSVAADAAIARAGARPVRGALGGVAKLAAVLAGQDALVHAGVDYALGPAGDEEAIDAFLAAARAAARPMTVVYTSGVWVLGATAAPTDEKGSTAHPAPLVAWRAAHEQAVLAAGSDHVAAAVIRPGIVYGERRGLVSPWFEQAVKEGAARVVGDGRNHWPFIHRADLAELYHRVIVKRGHGIFHGVDGAAISVGDAARAASKAAGRGAIVEVPFADAHRTMGPMADALVLDQLVVSTRGAEVGWKPAHPSFPQDAVAAFREWLH